MMDNEYDDDDDDDDNGDDDDNSLVQDVTRSHSLTKPHSGGWDDLAFNRHYDRVRRVDKFGDRLRYTLDSLSRRIDNGFVLVDCDRGKGAADNQNDESAPLSPGRSVLFCGIIDILQSFNVRKRLESAAKGAYYARKGGREGVSCVNPRWYGRRFRRFIEKEVILCEHEENVNGKGETDRREDEDMENVAIANCCMP